MTQMSWKGVIPAITTPFHEDQTVDHDFLAKHCQWLIDNGCNGIVALGSLGEGATLEHDDSLVGASQHVRRLHAGDAGTQNDAVIAGGHGGLLS